MSPYELHGIVRDLLQRVSALEAHCRVGTFTPEESRPVPTPKAASAASDTGNHAGSNAGDDEIPPPPPVD